MEVVVDDTSINEARVIDDPPVLRGLRLIGVTSEEIAAELDVTPGRIRQFRNGPHATDRQVQLMEYLLHDRIEDLRWKLMRGEVPKRYQADRRIVMEAAYDLFLISKYASEDMPEDVKRRLSFRYSEDSNAYFFDRDNNGNARIVTGPFAQIASYASERGPVEETDEPVEQVNLKDIEQ